MTFDLLLSGVLVQIPTTSVGVIAVEEFGVHTIIELLIKGGWIMIPIGLFFFLSIYLITERALIYARVDHDPSLFLNEIQNLVVKGDLKNAREHCTQVNTPFARMIDKGLSKVGTPLRSIETAIENAGKLELHKLEKNLSLLATCAGVGPMLGFMGTVMGLIQAFMAMTQEGGSMSPKLLSSGIYEAMVTTLAGLVVGFIAYLGYNYLLNKLQNIKSRMEFACIEFLEVLQQPK